MRRSMIQVIEDYVGGKHVARWSPELGWHHPGDHELRMAEYRDGKET